MNAIVDKQTNSLRQQTICAFTGREVLDKAVINDCFRVLLGRATEPVHANLARDAQSHIAHHVLKQRKGFTAIQERVWERRLANKSAHASRYSEFSHTTSLSAIQVDNAQHGCQYPAPNPRVPTKRTSRIAPTPLLDTKWRNRFSAY